MTKLTHLDHAGNAAMVDISAKAATIREAIAEGRITMSADALSAIKEGVVKKGDVLATARIAGIMAAKKTSDLIPLCHPIALSSVTVEFRLGDFTLGDTAITSIKRRTRASESACGTSAVLSFTVELGRAGTQVRADP